MASFRMHRRAFLRGLGSAAIALPMLEVMTDGRSSQAAEPPKRYLVLFGGQSLGSDNDPLHNVLVPDMAGTYDPSLKTATEPFAQYDVAKHISIVSGLYIPEANGGAAPPGGRPDDFHINSLGPLFSGVRSLDHDV